MSSDFKVFVSNIPYECNEDNVNEVLCEYEGYKTCVINRNNTGESKGYGLLFFLTKEAGMKILEANIGLHGKTLRLQKYISTPKQNSNTSKYVLYLDNLTDDITVEQLTYHVNDIYGGNVVTKCVVNKNNYGKIHSVLEVSNDEVFNKLITDGTLVINGNNISVKRYVNKQVNIRVPNNMDNLSKRNIYIQGFNAGRKYGYNECLYNK